MTLRSRALAATHPGRKRTINEDRFCDRGDIGLWAVADGMGGHAHGDWASNAVVQALESLTLPAAFPDATQAVADAVHSANRRIWGEAQRRTQQMGSTVVALLVRDDCFAALWVGDSRAYVLREGMLHPLTRDHSQVQEMVDRGLISAEAARHHPRGHVLARAVGVGARLAVDVVSDEAQEGDVFLLCSDGLTGTVEEAEIARLMALPDRQAGLDGLIAAALAAGAPDNVTAILVSVQETTRMAPASVAR